MTAHPGLAQFVELMQGVESQPQVCALLDSPVLAADANALPTMLDQLERCQKALADFLEDKRSRFPRFYFIGDECVNLRVAGVSLSSLLTTHTNHPVYLIVSIHGLWNTFFLIPFSMTPASFYILNASFIRLSFPNPSPPPILQRHARDSRPGAKGVRHPVAPQKDVCGH